MLRKEKLPVVFSNSEKWFLFYLHLTVRRVHLSATSAVTEVIHGQVRAVELAEYTDKWLTERERVFLHNLMAAILVPRLMKRRHVGPQNNPVGVELFYVNSSFCSNECAWLSEWMKTLHRLKKDRFSILILPPITCCHYTIFSFARLSCLAL